MRHRRRITLQRHEATHMIAGVLVEGLDDPEIDHDWLATSHELFMASFRQHGGRVRVYLVPGVEQKARFAGWDGTAEFMRSANFAPPAVRRALGQRPPRRSSGDLCRGRHP